MQTITIDGVSYDIETLSENSRKIIASLQFIEEELLKRRNILAVSDTARIGYANALKRELDAKG